MSCNTFMRCIVVLYLLLATFTARAVDSVVVFNEVHYHPATNEAAAEWVELHNQMAVDIDLSAWSLRGEVEYTFPEGTVIPGQGYLVVASDPAALRAWMGVTNLIGPFSGRLNNSRGTLTLRDRNDRVMDRFEYRDQGKWPVAPDGAGATLAKRNPDSTSAEAEHWASSVVADGTPGARNFPAEQSASPRPLIPLNALWRFEASGTDLGIAWRQPGYDDAGWSGRNNATLVSYWTFDGNATATRGTSGSLVGAVTAANDRNNQPNGALAFGGPSQHVTVPGGGGLNAATAGTISMWVKWNGTQDGDCCSTFGAVLARQANAMFSDNILALNAANPATARIVWRQSGGPAPVLITGNAAVGTNWHHVVVTFANSGSTLYVDGIAQGSAAGAGLNNNAAIPLSIGAWASDGGGFATATIDDVAIWDQTVTAAQVAQLAAQTRTPLDFLTPESAIYFAGDGRLTSNDELRRTVLPLGPTTHYFRNMFVFDSDPALTELKLDLAVDDGAVIYLNGAEVYRHNMPSGTIGHATLASTPIADAPIINAITLPTTNLLRGTNVLAVEVHQAMASDAGMVFGAALTALVDPARPLETRTLIAVNDAWQYDSTGADLGTTWREFAYDDNAWPTGAAAIYAGGGTIDGVPPERITNVTATASSQYLQDRRLAINAVNGAGLVGNAHVVTPADSMWLNNGTFVLPNDTNAWIQFDLGAVHPLRSMKVWNYNETLPANPLLLSRGVSRSDILSGVSTGALSMLIAEQAFTKAPGTQTDFSELVPLGETPARFVRLQNLTNFPGGDFRFVGLSEVQFFRDADLRRTQVPVGATTYYFRKRFNFGAAPGRATLFLNAAIDDGAVFYLNGVEVRRINMPAGTVTHGTPGNPVGNATFTGPTVLAVTNLRQGANVLAVEVHQSAALSDTDMLFAVELRAEITPRPDSDFVPGHLSFNEITAALANPFQIELRNSGAQSFDLAGYVIRRTGGSADASYTFGAQALAAGAFLNLAQGTLGFSAAAGDKLFLIRPDGAVADAVEVHERPRARSTTREGEWLTPSAATFGAANSFTLSDDIVINEIMYHAPPTLEIPAIIGSNTVITFSNVWKYHDAGVDLGTAWRTPGYDDTQWPSGAALLYNNTNNLQMPRNTLVNFGPNTHYFRTTFVYTGAPQILALSMRHIVDDGAVFYLNGAEFNRFNMPFGAISYTNFSSSAAGNATIRPVANLAMTNLVIGTNVLAVEVHQSVNHGEDVAFGMELTARVEAVPRVPFQESSEGWVEFFNCGSNAVDLTGWRLDEGIDYRFPSNTTIAPGGYLVVANDPAAFQANFPGINVVGPYTNALSHRGERIVLKDSADNPADSVHYFDDARWPRQADGRGSSLELRDPFADNAAGEAWAASDETARSSWRTYTYRGNPAASATGPDGQWREFVIGLLAAGEVLLDDISVTTNNVQILTNGTFTTGLTGWRIIGNHHGEVIDDPDQPGNNVLRLVAAGSTEHMSNHGETTLLGNADVSSAREYVISFRAKWISGSRQFHTRLYFNRLPRTTLLDAPTIRGTPGTRNTALAPNIGPTYAGLRHDPPVPLAFAPVTVSVQVNDPDGVNTADLWSRVDGQPWSRAAMTGDGSGNFSGSISGKTSGTVVQFFVEATDTLGAASTFPAEGTNSRALFKVDDGLAATHGLHNFRIVTLADDTTELFRTINLMSNERVGSTVIYNEREIFYDTGLRIKGSEHSRTTTPRLGFNVSFTSEQRFRGVHDTVAIDRSESTGFGQREMLIHQTLNHAGGVPTKYHDLIHVMAPRNEYTGSAELQLARYTDVFLEDQYEDGAEGTVFEYELVYQLNSTDTGQPTGNKVPAADSVTGTTIRNMGDDKENYRWTFLIKNNEDRDDYSGIMAFAKTMELGGTAFNSAITNIIILDQWFRGVAVNALSGAGDSYGGDGSQHNVQFYVRPGDKKVLYLPHDVDAFFDATRQIVPSSDMQKFMAVPAWARLYYSHVMDIINTTYNANYLTRWANHFGRLLPAQNFSAHLSFISQRVNIVTAQVNGAVPNLPFAITSNSGNNFGTSNTIVTLTGSAPLSIRFIEVNGVLYPINWTTVTAWSISVPLFAGPNQLRVQGINANGTLLTNAVDNITVTNNGVGAFLPLVINEWMADNDGPDGFADPLDGQFADWIELYNPNTNEVNIGGFSLTDDLADPAKWRIPSPTVIAPRGFLLVWADNETNQNALDPFGNLHAGFSLRREGEAIGLFNTAGVEQHSVTFGLQTLNVSQGWFPDGTTNLHLMTNWTPRLPNSLTARLQISSVAAQGGTVTLIWSAVPGTTYRLQYKNRLDSSEWIVTGAPVSANGITATTTDTPPPNSTRFYRIAEAGP
jgi:hypothetical protein